MPKNMPLWSLISAVVLIITLGIVILTMPADKLTASQTGIFVALVVSSVPSLLAAAYAERTSRDVRNGVVAEKAREGAVQAIEEQGVLTQSGPVATAAIAATEESTKALAKANTALATVLEHVSPLPVVTPVNETENDNGR